MSKDNDAQSTSYNDRALHEGDNAALPKPQIEIIVDGNSVFKPGMKTYFVDDYKNGEGEYVGKVMGVYCSCDTVVSTHVVCTCEAVCTCESVCSCLAYQSTVCTANVSGCPTNKGSGGTRTVSCGAPCACVPVH